MNVAAYNPETTNLEKTYISSYTAKASTVLPVKNNDRLINLRRVLVGRMGDERAELRTLSAVNTNKIAITVDATLFDHNADDPVYLLEWDQIRFYRASSLGGAYTLVNTVDLDVDNENAVTVWDDPAATAASYYKTSFYNSVTALESGLSDPSKASGFDVLSAGSVIDQHVRRVRDTQYTVLGPQEYLDIMNEVGSDLITQAHKPYRFLKKTVVLDTVAGQNYVSFPSTLWKFNYAFIATTLGSYKDFAEVTPDSLEQFLGSYDNSQVLSQDNVQRIAVDEENNRLMIYPTPKTSQTGVIKLSYWKKFDTLISMGQTIETPNPLIYRYKLLAEYYSAKSETDRQWASLSEKYETKYGAELVKMQRVNRLDAGTPRSFMPNRYVRRRRYHL